jgi:hypothetical protein
VNGLEFFLRSLPNPNACEILLPNSSSSKNFATCIVVDFAAARRQRSREERRERPSGAERAVEWQRQLHSSAVASRAAIARREGLSRARVTQLLKRLERVAGRKHQTAGG